MNRRQPDDAWSLEQGPRAPRPWYQLVLGQWPLAVVLAGVAAGLAWVALSHWKRGSFTIGATFLVATLLRSVLPEDRVGLLAVRNRWLDVLCYVLLGAGIVTLSLIVPAQP